MGNEQQTGSSHHFVTHNPNDGFSQQKRHDILFSKNGHVSISRQESTIKPSWQLARDASMEILSRKTTKLNFKQGEKIPSF